MLRSMESMGEAKLPEAYDISVLWRLLVISSNILHC